jgi:hypothetical protein
MGSKPSFIERMRGKRTSDIRLPNDTGARDKRLPPSTKADDIRRGYDAVQGLIKAIDAKKPKK